MFENCRATIVMEDPIGTKSEKNENVYEGTVSMYDPKTECIYLNLEELDLSKISLDAVYRCTIFLEEEATECMGRVRERFLGKSGNILILQIENGFYKININ